MFLSKLFFPTRQHTLQPFSEMCSSDCKKFRKKTSFEVTFSQKKVAHKLKTQNYFSTFFFSLKSVHPQQMYDPKLVDY